MAFMNNDLSNLYNALSNQNVKFLSGTQSNLNALITNGNAVEGAFYLTIDTHRLYVGRKKTSGDSQNKVYPVPVNEGVLTVQNLTALNGVTANPGEFYYLTDENILCVHNGQKWVQINTDTSISEFTSDASLKTGTKTAIITNNVKDSGTANLTGSLEITAGDGLNIAVTPATKTDSKVTKAGNITLTGEKYTISANEKTASDNFGAGSFTVDLNSDLRGDNGKSSVTFAAGDNVNLSVDSDKNLVIKSKNTKLDPSNSSITNLASGFKIAIKDTDSTEFSGTLNPKIKVNSGASEISFNNGVATLNTYTSTEIDSKITTALQAADAMTFKGTLPIKEDLTYNFPTTNVKIGDTYITAAEGKYNDSDTKIGDLFIAVAKEGKSETNGVLAASDIDWIYIPSGKENELYYKGIQTTSGLGVILQETGTKNVLQFELEADSTNPISLTKTDIAGTKENEKIGSKVKVAHKTISTLTDSGASAAPTDAHTLTAAGTSSTSLTIPSFVATFDDYGHVSGINTTNYKVVDSHNHLSATDTKTTVNKDTNSDKATISHTIKMTDGEAGNLGFSINSNTLKCAVTNNQITFDMCWGSF